MQLDQSRIQFKGQVNLELAHHRMQPLQFRHDRCHDFVFLASELKGFPPKGFILGELFGQHIGEASSQQGEMVCNLQYLRGPKRFLKGAGVLAARKQFRPATK